MSEELFLFVNNELLNGTNVSSDKFWKGFDEIVHELAPKNKKLIEIRENLQRKEYIESLKLAGSKGLKLAEVMSYQHKGNSFEANIPEEITPEFVRSEVDFCFSA